METSAKGISLIKRHEALRLKAYRCPAGVMTIGYGHTGNVSVGDAIPIEVANSLLKHDLKSKEAAVNKLGLVLTQNQFDALVSFVFNVGEGNFGTSRLRAKVMANPNDPTIANEFRRWVYGGDGSRNGKDDDGDGITDEPGEKQKLPGLVKRREDEAILYFN